MNEPIQLLLMNKWELLNEHLCALDGYKDQVMLLTLVEGSRNIYITKDLLYQILYTVSTLYLNELRSSILLYFLTIT